MSNEQEMQRINLSLAQSERPLIVHVIFRLDVGGLENGLVNLINKMPADRFRHTIISLTDATGFRKRITRDDVEIYSLGKRPGLGLTIYGTLWVLLRKLKPQIVHTRNLPALEMSLIAMLAGVPIRVHGEHGRDVHDLDGKNPKYRRLRKVCDLWIDRYIALSKELVDWLRNDIGIRGEKITHICNGVDTKRFLAMPKRPMRGLAVPDIITDDAFLIGTVGRFQAVKNQVKLISAFSLMLEEDPELRNRARLMLVGDGPLRSEIEREIEARGVRNVSWLAGERDDVQPFFQAMDVFVLPSDAEGISNTILEAMSCGLPVVATDVGGNRELVADGETGFLVARNDVEAMSKAIARYAKDEGLRSRHGQIGAKRVRERFGMEAMISKYQSVYEHLLSSKDRKTLGGRRNVGSGA